MGFFDRLFGKGAKSGAAKRAELRGDLAKAVELYGMAGAPEEAARVMLLRGDAETDVSKRMVHYTQALATAPEGEVRRQARVKRAELVALQFGGAGTVSAAARKDLLSAAEDLEAAGEAARAAEVYRLAGDREGEARALAAAGDVEKLELLLHEQQVADRRGRERQDAAAELAMLLAGGKRREALRAAEQLAKHDPRLAEEKAAVIRGRVVEGAAVPLEIDGVKLTMLFGDEVVIGRTEGTLRVPSQAVSRQHVKVAREGGAIVARDLGSRNGTQLRGMDLVGGLPVGEGLELQLGKEVRLAIKPTEAIDGGVEIEIGGVTYLAPLGRARLAAGWLLERASDGWLELVSSREHPAYLGDTQLDERATLLAGDEISASRGGPVALRVGFSGAR